MKKRTLLTAAGMMSVALLAGCGNTANGTGKIESFAVESFVAESSVAKSSAAESSVAESSVAESGIAPGKETGDNASAPIQYETADGFMASFLLASDRERIDTTNDYGVLYRVVYQASLEGDELIACGSMDYRNFKGQDPITITSDQTHVFKVDDNTVYRMIGDESGTNTVTKEEFAGLLDKLKDSGMYFEVEISNGVAASATIGV